MAPPCQILQISGVSSIDSVVESTDIKVIGDFMMIGRFYGGMNTLYDETYLVMEVLEKAEQEQEEADKLKTENSLNQD